MKVWMIGIMGLACGCVAITCSFGSVAAPVDLRCEYLANPMGIDAVKPRLSWMIDVGDQNSEAQARRSHLGEGGSEDGNGKSEIGNLKDTPRGVKQTAYQVLVASSEKLLKEGKADLWDSGRVESDQSIHVAFAGKSLESLMQCFWKVRVWTASAQNPDLSAVALAKAEPRAQKPSPWSEPASWSMGLLKPEDWKKALWIRASAGLGGALSEPEVTAKNLKKATYRTLDGKVSVDVTEILKKELGNKQPFTVHFQTLGGDPAPGVVKELVVEYVKDGQFATLSARDFAPLMPMTAGLPCPWLRKVVEVKEIPERASVRVESRGYHELWVNGRKVGDSVLNPAVSVLKKRSLYVTYDIQPLLRKGANVIGLWLGRGWNAHGVPGVVDERPLVRLHADLVRAGTSVEFVSDGTWECAQSPYRTLGPWKWDNFGGEQYDARLERPLWCTVEDKGPWVPVEVAPTPAARTDSQLAPLNRIGKRMQAISCTEQDGGYVLDFGTDLSGWLRLDLPATESRKFVSFEYRDSGGRSYNQRDEFISAGRTNETFVSKFNYRGFRTVIVKGLPSAPALSDATALLIESDLEPTGSFECSNERINGIHALNLWTIRCLNLGGYLVDCPHRERLGYGDGQVSVESCIMNLWMPNFYGKWLQDWADTQGPTGELPFSTPYHPPAQGDTFGREGPPGWGGALPAITWRVYLYYGDRRILEKMVEPISRFMARMETHTVKGLLRTYGDNWQGLGDWVPPDRGMDTSNWPSKRANELFNNCYRIYLWQIMEQMNRVLGREEDARGCHSLIEKIRPLIHEEFYDAEQGLYVIDEQAYQLMPLMTGVVPDALRPALMKKLEDQILVKRKGHLDTGMLGTYFLLQYLSEIGRDDLLFPIVNQKTYPGWGYMVEQGATTMWEQWNGFWSRIHSCFTSPSGWFQNGLAGIRSDPAAPGFKRIIIKPAVVGDLQWVKCHYDSGYGRIVSNWKRSDPGLTMEVEIPPNTTATVYVPARAAEAVTESGRAAAVSAGVNFLRMEAGAAVYEVGSGHYKFSSILGN